MMTLIIQLKENLQTVLIFRLKMIVGTCTWASKNCSCALLEAWSTVVVMLCEPMCYLVLFICNPMFLFDLCRSLTELIPSFYSVLFVIPELRPPNKADLVFSFSVTSVSGITFTVMSI